MDHRFPINKPVETIERQVSFVEATMKSLIISLGIFLAILNFQDCQGYPTHHHNLRGHHHIQKRRSISEDKEFEKYLKKQNITDINSIKDEKKILKIVREFFTKKLLPATKETEQAVSEKRARRNLVKKNGCLCSDNQNTPELDKILLDCLQSLTNPKKTCDLKKLKQNLSTCPKESSKKPNQTGDKDVSETDLDSEDSDGNAGDYDNPIKDEEDDFQEPDEYEDNVNEQTENPIGNKEDSSASQKIQDSPNHKSSPNNNSPLNNKNSPSNKSSQINNGSPNKQDSDLDQPGNSFENINWEELLCPIWKDLKKLICEKVCSDQTKAKRDAMQEEQDYIEKTTTASKTLEKGHKVTKLLSNQEGNLKNNSQLKSVKDQIDRKSESNSNQKMPGDKPESNSTLKPHKI